MRRSISPRRFAGATMSRYREVLVRFERLLGDERGSVWNGL
jgi:hypothetical protein